MHQITVDIKDKIKVKKKLLLKNEAVKYIKTKQVIYTFVHTTLNTKFI